MAEEAEKKKANLNYWKISTLVLAILSIVLILMFSWGRLTGNVVSEKDIGEKAVSYINSQLVGQGTVSLVSVEEKYGFYEVIVSYQGRQIPSYFTKDGQYFVGTQISSLNAQVINEEQEAQEVPKSDKPKVEAFIFSYCPYGLQFEKALIPVYDLLKTKADINIVAIGAMHGEYERQESLRQISIEKLYSTDKLFAYLKEFDNNANIGSCSGDDACLNKYLPAIYTKLGIDKTKIENYMKADALTIYNEQVEEAGSLGISGSPTFVINGVEVQVARTADAIKTAVCSAFNTAPAECSQALSTASASAGFGSSSSSSSSSASCS